MVQSTRRVKDALPARSAGKAHQKTNPPRPSKRATAYHHGALRVALLEAAERVLNRDGIEGLTLRATAREVGVSHAAPKNHFGNIRGLVSDLAAVGFERLRAAQVAHVQESDPPPARMGAIGQGYIAFAKANPDLFLLMFRSERLDYSRPTLRVAMDQALGVLSGAIGERRQENIEEKLTMAQAASIAGAWSVVHGFALLLLDGRLKGLLARLPAGTDDIDLLGAIFSGAKPGGDGRRS